MRNVRNTTPIILTTDPLLWDKTHRMLLSQNNLLPRAINWLRVAKLGQGIA